VLPDPALGLTRENRLDEGIAVLSEEGMSRSDRPRVAFCVRSLRNLIRVRDVEDDSPVFGTLAHLCDKAVEEFDADVVFVPQQMYGIDDPLLDDRVAAEEIAERMTHSQRACVIRSERTVEETLAVYQCCELVVSTRRHGIVFAHSQFVPAVALSGDPNIEAYMGSVGQGKWLVRVEDIDSPRTWELLRAAWSARSATRAELEQRIPGLAERTREYARIAAGLGETAN
jgi:polysaccharide pyruvyl transferase WcaK-like protein